MLSSQVAEMILLFLLTCQTTAVECGAISEVAEISKVKIFMDSMFMSL